MKTKKHFVEKEVVQWAAQATPDQIAHNAALRAAYADDPSAMNAVDRARAEVLVKRQAAKAGKKKELKKKVKTIRQRDAAKSAVDYNSLPERQEAIAEAQLAAGIAAKRARARGDVGMAEAHLTAGAAAGGTASTTDPKPPKVKRLNNKRRKKLAAAVAAAAAAAAAAASNGSA